MAYGGADPKNVVSGGTGTGSFSTNGVVISGATGTTPLSALTLTNGQLVIGSTGSAPAAANLTAGSGVSISNGTGSITISAAGGVATTYTENSGTATPSANNLNVLGSGSITTSGSGSTITAALTGLTNHNVQVGAGTATLTQVAPSATSGIPLVSNGSSADPSFTTAVVAGGGTGNTTFTAYSVICAGTTATGAFQNVSGVGTSGQILTSNGAGALPTWQSAAASGITTINGDSGSCTGSTVTIFTSAGSQNYAGSTVKFINSLAQSALNFSDGADNTLLGHSAGNSSVSGIDNTATGVFALNALTSGTNNACFGWFSGNALRSGSYNTLIGQNSGNNYTSSESSNILIGNDGVASESHVIRIGKQGSGTSQQNICYIAGITGATPVSANTPQVVLCDNAGNLAPISSSTSGYVLTSNGSATPSFQAIPSQAMTWTDEGTSFSAAAGNGYFITASAVTATLPASPTQGQTIEFSVDAAVTNFVITANTGQKIRIGSAINSGTAGTATNNAQGDSVTLVYRSSSAVWIASSVIGTWTLS